MSVKQYCETEHKKPKFIAGETYVPVSGKVYDHSDMQNLVESGLDFWLTSGRFNREFEKSLAKFLGVQHVLTCNSGSSANLIALTSLTSHLLKDRALKAGDEVINCKLSTLADYFGATTSPNHRALEDAMATVDVLHGLIERLAGFNVHSFEQMRNFPSRKKRVKRPISE